MKIYASEIRVGMLIEYKDDLWQILKTQHVKPGKGGAFAQVEMKSVNKNTKLNERFRSSESVEKASLDETKYNYLYGDENDFYFIDPKSYEQINIKKETIGEVVGFNRLDESEACEFVSNITGDNSREVVSFGTEAGLFQELGISTVVCGPGYIEQAHKIDEFIELNEMKKCLKFLEGVKDKSLN